MFELRNENEIWYKSEDMIDWIHYGLLNIVERLDDFKYIIKFFDFETESYQPDLSVETYQINGETVLVANGIFEYIPEPLPAPEPTQLDRIEEAITKNQEEIRQEAIDNYTIQLIEEGLL